MVEPVRRRFQHKCLRERGYISAKILVGAGTIGLDMHSRSALGLVSRVTPVQTAKRNCTRDEGGPFEVGNQVADLKPPQAAAVKSHGGERCGKVGTRFRLV